MPIYTGSSKHLGGTETVTRRQENYYGLVQKNVLITGANGQLGNELRKRQEMSNNSFYFIFTDMGELDITDARQVDDFVREHSIRYIVNCAAYTAVDKAEEDVETAYRVNYNGPENLAVAANKHDAKMIHISTDYVFDGKSVIPYLENVRSNPQSVYGKSKLKGEEAILEALHDAIIIRTSWLYSEFGNNFVKTMIRLMNESDELNIVADQKGSPTYAADLAEMILVIMEDAEQTEWKPGIYHFSNAGETTWFHFAAKIKELAGIERCTLNPIKTEEYKTVAERPAYSVMDIFKIKNTFHVEVPKWDEALERCIGKLKINN